MRVKCLLLIATVSLLTLGLSSTQAAEVKNPYPLGDIGLPDDYVQTMRSYQEILDRTEAIVDMPDAFDWRTKGVVSPAKDQGGCGSCWAFASTGALESKIAMRGWPLMDLSEQQQVSCNTTMGGCSGGSMSALRFWENIGPLTEACAPYQAANTACSSLNGCDYLLQNTTGYYTVNANSVPDVQASLRNDGPTYFRFTVYSDFMTFWSSGSPGQVYQNSGGSILGGHAILIIGWDNAKSAWLCKNSWGENAGPNGDGTFWMAYSGHYHSLSFGMANVTLVNHPPVVWTGWYDRDDASGVGDFETLVDLTGVCANPVAIDCSTVGNVDWTDTGETVTCDPAIGLTCVNANQGDGYCLDYKVRFACPGTWTAWLNRDYPGGVGDFETLVNFTGICANPIAVDAKTSTDIYWTETDETLTCRPDYGLSCVNADQDDLYCLNYNVRFACP